MVVEPHVAAVFTQDAARDAQAQATAVAVRVAAMRQADIGLEDLLVRALGQARAVMAMRSP